MPVAKKPYVIERTPEPELEDLRDDCIAIVLNSKLNFREVHDRGGPTPQTTSKWLHRETKFPRLSTIRSMLNACDHDLTIMERGSKDIRRYGHEGIEYPKPKTRLRQRREDRKTKRLNGRKK